MAQLDTLFTGIALIGLVATLYLEISGRQSQAVDHKNEIERLEAQIVAAKHSAYVASLVGRIQAYTGQIEVYKNDQIRLLNEQNELIRELDRALQTGRAMNGGAA